MPRETYSANGITYTVAPDRDAPLGGRPQAVITVIVVDELTALAPAGAIRIDSPVTGMTARTGLGGLAGFAAIPTRVFSRLGSQAYHVPVEIRAEGYLDVSLVITVDQANGFPDAFKRAGTVTLSLHRQPMAIYGRAVVASSAGIAPAAGAAVRITGLWRTLPAANAIVPPEPPNVVSLNPPLYIDRSAAGTQVAGLDFLGAPGPDKQLLAETTAGNFQIPLSDCLALGISDVLAIDTEDSVLTEFIEVKSIARSGGDNVLATITLAYPLRFTHRRNAIAHRVAFQPPGRRPRWRRTRSPEMFVHS